jgi:hypothetical protein
MKITNSTYCGPKVFTPTGDTIIKITGDTVIDTTSVTRIDVTGNATISSNSATTLLVTGNIYASNSVTTTNLHLSSSTLQFDPTAGIYNATIGSISGIIPTQYIYVLNSDRDVVNLAHAVVNPMLPPIYGITNLGNGKYYIRIEHNLSITTATSGATNYLAAYYAGSAVYTLDVMSIALRNGSLYPTRNTTKLTVIAVTTNLSPNTPYTYMFVYTGVINVTTPGSITFNFLSVNSSSLPLQAGTIFAGSSILLQPIGVTGADINIGGWAP